MTGGEDPACTTRAQLPHARGRFEPLALQSQFGIHPTHSVIPHRGNPHKGLLLAAAETHPGSAAKCEIGFHAMNETVWDKRNTI